MKNTISATSPTVEPGGVKMDKKQKENEKHDFRDVTDCRARRGKNGQQKQKEQGKNDFRDVTDCRARRAISVTSPTVEPGG
eukprot:113935-Alexandrium_andersonii.AAC.1